MSENYRVGEQIKWKWGNGYGEGKIIERFTEKVSRVIEGTQVTRTASDDEPAYLIEQDDGSRVLKSCSELEK